MTRSARLIATIMLTGTLTGACSLLGFQDQAAVPEPADAPQLASLEIMFPDFTEYQPDNLPAGSCMTEQEIQGEQFIKLHTELMVTGLTCGAAYRDPALFSQYQDFTVTHQDRIRRTQTLLADFLGRYRSGNRNRLFDTYRTEVANNESQQVLDVTAAQYCARQRNRFYTASAFTDAELDAFLANAVDLYRDRYIACPG